MATTKIFEKVFLCNQLSKWLRLGALLTEIFKSLLIAFTYLESFQKQPYLQVGVKMEGFQIRTKN